MGDALGQMAEAIVGLEVRGALGQGEELAEPSAQLALGAPQGAQVAALSGGGHGAACVHHPLQGRLFEAHVLPADLDQLGELVVTLLQGHVYV